jgi:hypothetical protein
MPYTFTNGGYANIHFTYGFCNENSGTAVVEYRNVTHIVEHLTLYTEFSERLVPSLQVMPDILFTDEAQFTQEFNANTRNSHFLPYENPQLVTQCHFQH